MASGGSVYPGYLQGMQGMQGMHGMQGLQGVQGMQGMQGVQGMQGMQGLTYMLPHMLPLQSLLQPSYPPSTSLYPYLGGVPAQEAEETKEVAREASPRQEAGAGEQEEREEYLGELAREREAMVGRGVSRDSLLLRLLEREVSLVGSGHAGPAMDADRRLLDVYREKPVRLTVRVAVPVKEHPKVQGYTGTTSTRLSVHCISHRDTPKTIKDILLSQQ